LENWLSASKTGSENTEFQGNKCMKLKRKRKRTRRVLTGFHVASYFLACIVDMYSIDPGICTKAIGLLVSAFSQEKEAEPCVTRSLI